MRYSTQVKPHQLFEGQRCRSIVVAGRAPMVITQNGDAKAVIQDVASYEETQEALALLKILASGCQDIQQGKVVTAVGEVSNSG